MNSAYVAKARCAKRRKVLAYITSNNRLLVFSHPHHPEAGIQVPAGTLGDDETPERAVMREALEETGLTELTLDCLLGEQIRDMADCNLDQIHHRYFFHLRCIGNPPATWRHIEEFPDDKSGEHIFEFFWARLPDRVPELTGEHGKMIPKLLECLADES